MIKFSRFLTGAAICAVSAVAFANGGLKQDNSYVKEGFIIGADGGYGYVNESEAVYPNDFSGMFGSQNPELFVYSTDTDIGDVVLGAHVGYDFKVLSNLLFGWELGYKDFGKSSNEFSLMGGKNTQRLDFSKDYHQSAVDFLLTTHYYPTSSGLNFFAKAGVAYVKSHAEQSFYSDVTNIRFDNNNNNNNNGSGLDLSMLNGLIGGDYTIWRIEPEVGFGVGYTFATHVDVHASYVHTGRSSPDSDVLPERAKVYTTNSILGGISYTF